MTKKKEAEKVQEQVGEPVRKPATKKRQGKPHMRVVCHGAPALNVREEPALAGAIVGELEDGIEFDVLDERDSWYLTANGWVMAKFCEPA